LHSQQQEYAMLWLQRIAIATAIVFAAAAPARAQGSFSELQGITTEIKPVEKNRSVLSDMPEAPPGAQPQPGTQPQTLKRGAPPNSSAPGGWYQVQPTVTLRGPDPSAATKGPNIKYQMFKPNGAPVR
jgi:hypothetical protein